MDGLGLPAGSHRLCCSLSVFFLIVMGGAKMQKRDGVNVGDGTEGR